MMTMRTGTVVESLSTGKPGDLFDSNQEVQPLFDMSCLRTMVNSMGNLSEKGHHKWWRWKNFITETL